jgi:hypothetical protein
VRGSEGVEGVEVLKVLRRAISVPQHLSTFNTSSPSATIPAVQGGHHIMKLDVRDFALRALILVAGGLAAILLSLKGHGEALPALAVGGTLGACMMASLSPKEE